MARARVRKREGPSFREIKARMARETIGIETDVARAVAPYLTALARSDFAAGRNAYGEPRKPGFHGRVTLVDTGAMFELLRFVSFGRILRCALGTPYAKYMIGRFEVLPIGDRTGVPPRWATLIDTALSAVRLARAA
jgi:hypothetical protein